MHRVYVSHMCRMYAPHTYRMYIPSTYLALVGTAEVNAMQLLETVLNAMHHSHDVLDICLIQECKL